VVQRRLLLIEEKVLAFLTYASHTLHQETPAVERLSVEIMRQQLEDLVKVFRDVGDQEMVHISEDLQQYRFRDWAELAVN
jgi:hypothetical protein